jgi:echinoderm microtubule-associated protein-like 1/2
MTAALGVVLDHECTPPQQKFFGGGEVDNTAKNVANDTKAHTDDIMSIGICGARKVAVTGQVGRAPAVFTWDACSGEMMQRMKLPRGSRGVSAINISPCAGWVAAVDLHNDHRVHCFNAATGECKFMEKGSTDKILDVAFDRCAGSNRFATAGCKHIAFWTTDGEKEGGLFGSTPRTSFSCCAFDTKGRCFAGGANGKIYCFEGRSAQSAMEAHKGFICGIKCFGDNKMLTGARDGIVKLWNTDDMSCTKEWQFDSLVRAVDMDDSESTLIVGLRDGCIWHVNMADDSRKAVMMSHSDGEVWGLQVDDCGVWTSGDDNKVMLWDADNHCFSKQVSVTDRREGQIRGKGASTLSKCPASQQSRAVATNADWIAISGNDGKVSIRAKSDPSTECHLLKEAREWNECMAFSPCNTYFAVGSHDNYVYIYNVADWSCMGKLKGHSSFIVAFDWSCDSTYIRSNCGAHEILYF